MLKYIFIVSSCILLSLEGFAMDRGCYIKIENYTNNSFKFYRGYGDWCDGFHFLKNGQDYGNNNVTIDPQEKDAEIDFQGSDVHSWSQKISTNPNGVGDFEIMFAANDRNAEDGTQIIGTDNNKFWVAADTDNNKDLVLTGDLYFGSGAHKGDACYGVVYLYPGINKDRVFDGVNDSKKITELNIVGTHDSATGGIDNILYFSAKCQKLNFTEQLHAGVRAFDLRLGAASGPTPSWTKSDHLGFWHSSFFCNSNFEDFIMSGLDFLRDNPNEFIIAFVKKENSLSGIDWNALFYEYLNAAGAQHYFRPVSDLFVLNPKAFDLTIKDVRGKIIFVSRSGESAIDNTPQIAWQDNTTFWAKAGDTDLYISDCYNKSTSEKIGILNNDITYAYSLNLKILPIIFTSGYEGIPDPKSYERNVLSSISNNTELWHGVSGRYGIIMMDYVGDANGSTSIINDILSRNKNMLKDL